MAAIPTPAGPVYTIERGDAVLHRDTVLALWRENLRDDPNREGKFDWFYRNDNPWGTAAFHLLRHEPSRTWVGTAAIGHRRMQYRGRDVRAGVLADMAVDARHRSLGPALMLQTGLLETAAGEFDLLYGIPNKKPAAVMQRLGYAVLARLPRFSCVLRHHEYLNRRVPYLPVRFLGWLGDSIRRGRDAAWRFSGLTPCVEWSHGADPRVDELWQRSWPRNTLMAPRDAALLRWRFDRFPGGGTRYLLLTHPRSGDLLAWFACQPDGSYLHVRDFWAHDAARGTSRRYIAALLRAASAAGYAAVDIEYGAPSAKQANWISQGFVERGHRLVVGRWVGEQPMQTLPDDYHFTAADEDV